MLQRNYSFYEARKTLLAAVSPVGSEKIALADSGGRVLARDLTAAENIPAFDRSPYDGYAFRAADTAGASRETPVTLRILEEIPAGGVPQCEITAGTAAKILTGAPVPPGADAVIMFEKTAFTDETVSLFAPCRSGDNIVRVGEDVKQGEVLARAGQIIDAGLAGTLAAQGVSEPEVFRRPRVALISIGSELVEAEEMPGPGKIRNSNRAMLEAALRAQGCEPVYYGIAGDCAGEIAALFSAALTDCDAVVSTGGVSVGDYDQTPQAMEMAGAEILFHGVDLKPGMACAYGRRDGKLICALSGNPASSITNFYDIAAPALRKLAAQARPDGEEVAVMPRDGFGQKRPGTRLPRGRLVLAGARVRMTVPRDQGNVVLSSTIGCNVMAIVPAGSGPVSAGTTLKGFLL